MGGRGRAAKRDMGEAVQKCNCGGAACKGAKVGAGTTSWPVDKLTGGQVSKYLAQRGTGDRIVGWGHWVGLTILGRPRSSRDARPYLARRSREVVAVGGWRLGTAERQRPTKDGRPYLAERTPRSGAPTLTWGAGWAEWRGVLKNANTLSMQDQLTLTPGSFRA